MFERENRYQVIKLKTGKPVECVVVEKDWPEYELVWQMIQDRVEGRLNEIERLKEKNAELVAALELAKAGFSQAASGRIAQKYLEEHFEAASAAIARVKGDAAIEAQPAQEPVGNMRGFSVWLCREDWGHVTDGLILERERSLQRKASNPESNSNYIADRCAEIIKVLNQAATIKTDAEQPAQEPVAFLVEGKHGGQVIAHGLHHDIATARKMASAFAAHYPEVKTTPLWPITPQPASAAASAEAMRDVARLDWLDDVLSVPGGRRLICLPGKLRAALDEAMEEMMDQE